MKDLKRNRKLWMDSIPSRIEGPATGFYGVAATFHNIFDGEAWSPYQQGRPQQNITFIAATATFTNRTAIVLLREFISHVQPTLWHTPLNSRPWNIPAHTVGGPYDLNSTVDMTVQDERLVLVIHINYVVLGTVVGVVLFLGLGAIFYLVTAEDQTIGRLMRDLLVHLLTVPGYNGAGILNSCMARLEIVLHEAGKQKLVYGAAPGFLGHLAIQAAIGPQTNYALPIPGLWHGAVQEDNGGRKQM